MSDQLRPPDHAANSAVCPGCGAPLSEEKVLCIDCGYNRNLGKKLVTKKFTQTLQTPTETPAEEGGGFRWGFDNAEIVSGLGMMLVAAVWFGLGWMAGRIFLYPPILFIIGVIALLKGLVGEEGVW